MGVATTVVAKSMTAMTNSIGSIVMMCRSCRFLIDVLTQFMFSVNQLLTSDFIWHHQGVQLKQLPGLVFGRIFPSKNHE